MVVAVGAAVTVVGDDGVGGGGVGDGEECDDGMGDDRVVDDGVGDDGMGDDRAGDDGVGDGVGLAEASVLNKAKRKKTASLADMLRRRRELVGQVVRRGGVELQKTCGSSRASVHERLAISV